MPVRAAAGLTVDQERDRHWADSARFGDWSKYESAVVKVFGCRPMMTAPRTPGPASANLQGRKPREVGRDGASHAMGFDGCRARV